MPNIRYPRRGSMQYWPRKRAKTQVARVRSVPKGKGLLGFAGYKVGMTHAIIIDNRPNTKTKGEEISIPLTVLECPPIKIVGAVFYKKTVAGIRKAATIYGQIDKELQRTLKKPKKEQQKELASYVEARALVETQPKAIELKKTPEFFEMAIGGTITEQLQFIKDHMNKEIKVSDVFQDASVIDTHAVTKGKGFQGPVKRFGVSRRRHKSEKTIRGPGSLGGWSGQGKVMYRVAHAGQMGYHTRTEYNKQIIKVGTNPEEINPKGGFVSYGLVRSQFILIKGSVSGARKRMIKLIKALRPKDKLFKEAPAIVTIIK